MNQLILLRHLSTLVLHQLGWVITCDVAQSCLCILSKFNYQQWQHKIFPCVDTMCHTHVQCSIASIHVPYTRTVQYCQYPCVSHTHTHVQCSIASIHESYTHTVQYCQYPWVIHTYSAVLLVSMCHTHTHTYSAVLPVSMCHKHVQCSIASIHLSYTRTVQYC